MPPTRLRVAAFTAALGTAVATGAAALTAAAPAAAAVVPIPAVTDHVSTARFPGAAPPTTATCEARVGVACYSPLQLRVAYDLAPLYAHGDTGKGRTIAIVDSFGSPTIQADLDTFDAAYGLPATTVQIIQPAGAVPPYDDSDLRQNWAFETSLDVEYAHAIAPDAKILLVETPVAETEGVEGFPEIVQAENYVINHGLADVITQSFGATEDTFPSKQSLLALRSAYVNAAAHHVTVLASSGDDGATDAEADGSTTYPYRVNSWPSTDPLVTSIGGTQLHLDATGNRTSPDVVWNDGYGAGGGGVSKVFARPLFQIGVKSVVGAARGTPDISLSAAVDGGALVYISFDAASTGWHIVGGTSEASPLFSGIVALSDQLAGHKLGDVNPALYALGAVRSPSRTGEVDVTSGDNSFAGVTGYTASSGYDLASGWGTVDAAKFVPALAAAGSLL